MAVPRYIWSRPRPVTVDACPPSSETAQKKDRPLGLWLSLSFLTVLLMTLAATFPIPGVPSQVARKQTPVLTIARLPQGQIVQFDRDQLLELPIQRLGTELMETGEHHQFAGVRFRDVVGDLPETTRGVHAMAPNGSSVIVSRETAANPKTLLMLTPNPSPLRNSEMEGDPEKALWMLYTFESPPTPIRGAPSSIWRVNQLQIIE